MKILCLFLILSVTLPTLVAGSWCYKTRLGCLKYCSMFAFCYEDKEKNYHYCSGFYFPPTQFGINPILNIGREVPPDDYPDDYFWC